MEGENNKEKNEKLEIDGNEEGDFEDEGEAFIDPNSTDGQEVIYLDDNEMGGEDGEMGEEDDDDIETHTKSEFTQINTEDEVIDDNSDKTFKGHTDAVCCVDLSSANPDVAVSGGLDDKAWIWSTKTGEPLFELNDHKDTVSGIKINFDGKLVATSGYDGVVKVWDMSDGKLLNTLTGPGDALDWLTWHPKGNVILSGGQDGTSWLWSSTGKCLAVFAGHSQPVTLGEFTADGKGVVTASEDATVRVWDPKTSASTFTIKGKNFHQDPIVSLGMSPTANVCVTGSVTGEVFISNLSNGKVLGSLTPHTDSVEAVTFQPNSNEKAATGSLDKTVKIWSSSTAQLISTCEHDDGVVRVKWHPTQPLIFSCSSDRTVRMWDSRNGKCEKIFSGHRAAILDFAINANGTMVVSGSDDQTAKIFKI